MLTIGSLCSGYGGLDRAAVAAFGGGEILWHAEIEPGPVKILEAHWPRALNVGDIKDAHWRSWDRPDVLTMGVPCQPVSAAGRQRGDQDERWLWPYAHRAIVDLGCPTYLVFENVRNLISIEGGRLRRGILADLRATGYAVRWLTIGACRIGFCHHRHRVFALAKFVGCGDAPLAERIAVQECGARRGQGRELLPSPAARDGDGRGEGDGGYWDRRTREGGRTNGRPLAAALLMEQALLPSPRSIDATRGPASPDRVREQGNGQDLAQVLNSLPGASDLLPTPRASDAKNGGPNQGIAAGDVALSSAVIGDRFGKYADAVELHAQLLRLVPPEPTEIGPRGGNRLAPAFPEWMMGLRPGYLTDHVDRASALKAAGNGVVPQQAFEALRILRAD